MRILDMEILTKIVSIALQLHLFDIDIPEEISFKESDTFKAGDEPTVVDTGIIHIPFGFLLLHIVCNIFFSLPN